jgi:hypothetical protein
MDLLRSVVKFANEGTLSGVPLCAPDVRVMTPLRVEPKYVARVDGTPIDETHMAVQEIPSTPVLLPAERQAVLRAQLRADLSNATIAKISARDMKRLTCSAAETVAMPTYDMSVRKRQRVLRVRWHYWPDCLEAILSYGVLLLCDDERGSGTDLKQCQLKGCGQFFFVSDHKKHTGRPRASYCSDEHRDQAHQATSYARVLKWRRKQATANKGST